MNDAKNTVLDKNDDNIIDSIVRIVDSKNNFYGTAFFIHNKYCVTCHHCICEIEEDKIYIQRANKKYAVEWAKEYSDMDKNIAILKINDSTSKTNGTSFKTLGSALDNSLLLSPDITVPSSFFIWTFLPNKINNDSFLDMMPEKNEVDQIPLRYQLKEVQEQQQTKRVIKKEWNKKPSIEMDNLYIYKLPGKKLDIRYSGSPVCYSNNNNIVVGMITDNEDENFCLNIPMYIILKKFEVNEVTKWINKGLSLYESGEIRNAIECYDNALKINPNNSKAWLVKAEALYNLSEYQRACGCYRRALELLNPNTEVNDISLKRYYCYESAWDENDIKYYEEYSKVNKEDPTPYSRAWVSKRAWHRKGYNLINLGEYERAIECYNKAIELDSNNLNAWNDKGVALYFLGRYKEAIECYNGVLQLNPDHIDAYINKGFALRKLGEYQQAIICYNKAKAINPKYKENTWSEKGNNLTVLGKYKQAIECYDNSLEINPNDAYTLEKKGNCLSKLGIENAAQECFDKAKRLESSSQQNC